MSRGRLTFSTRDVTAAIRLAERTTGRAVIRVEIAGDGRIIIELASPASNDTTPIREPANEWDEVLK